MYNLTEFCCLCLERDKNVTPQSSINSNARDIMEYIIPEFILQKSEIPIQVCYNCLNKMNSFFKFRQSCSQNIIKFSECIQKLIAIHGPHKYLSVTINEIPRKISVEENFENSKQPNCGIIVKSEIFEEENNISLIEDQSEINNKNIEQVLIKVEDSVDNLYVNEEIDGELMIEDYSSFSDDVIQEIGIVAPSDVANRKDTQSRYTDTTRTNSKKNQPRSSTSNLKTRTYLPLYQCDLCKRSYKEPSSLKSHLCTRKVIDPFSCDICHKTFAYPHAVNRHRRIHTGEKPFKCDICQKTFNQMGTLRAHKRVHTGERPYSCNVCGKDFTYSHHLSRHKRLNCTNKKVLSKTDHLKKESCDF